MRVTDPRLISRRALVASAAAMLAPTAFGQAAAYPAKPVTWIVPFAAGGGLDNLARPIAAGAERTLGRPFVIENRPGGGGTIAAAAFTREPADGYAVFHGSNGTHAIGPALYENVRFDPLKDFIPITRLTSMGMMIVVSASSPITSLRQLMADLRARPGGRSFGSSGVGSLQHMGGELFKAATNTDILHVPYRGSGAARVDLLGGRIDMMFDTTNGAAEQVKAGRLRAIALLSDVARPFFPEVETVSSAGIRDLNVVAWDALFAPAGTPRPVVETLNASVTSALRSPEIVQSLLARGVVATPTSSEEARSYLKSEIVLWGEAVKRSGARAE